jgi:hypothetical protein
MIDSNYWLTVSLVSLVVAILFATWLVIEQADLTITHWRERRRQRRDDEIKQIAYRVWKDAGSPTGHDLEHWKQAESIWEQQHGKKI